MSGILFGQPKQRASSKYPRYWYKVSLLVLIRKSWSRAKKTYNGPPIMAATF